MKKLSMISLLSFVAACTGTTAPSSTVDEAEVVEGAKYALAFGCECSGASCSATELDNLNAYYSDGQPERLHLKAFFKTTPRADYADGQVDVEGTLDEAASNEKMAAYAGFVSFDPLRKTPVAAPTKGEPLVGAVARIERQLIENARAGVPKSSIRGVVEVDAAGTTLAYSCFLASRYVD